MTNATEQEKLEGKILAVGTHHMGWVDKFLSGEEIRDCLTKARELFPDQAHSSWLSGIIGELPVLRYRGRYSIADGGALSGGTDGEVFENFNEKGLRYYATPGIYRVKIGRAKTGERGVIFECINPINVTDWYSHETWRQLLKGRF